MFDIIFNLMKQIKAQLIDMDAAKCEVSQIQRLDRYSLKHIITLPEQTKLLLLVVSSIGQ